MRSAPLDLERALVQRQVVVCVGSGGVGKTTVAATLALRAAALGRKAIVLTIDPARRLANALGLASLGNEERRVEDPWLEERSADGGELWAMMLDLERSWDDFIRRTVPPDRAEVILQNRFYQTLSSALAGSQEYIAMEKLYELYDRGAWDLLVLDTPPTANALDFLDAPNRVLDFLDNEAARIVLGPALAAGRAGRRIFDLGGNYLGRTIARFTGGEMLQELGRFLIEVRGTYGVFKDRAAKVKELLASDRAAFVLVTSAHAATVDEAIRFHGLLAQERMPIAAVVANRVHRDFLAGLPLPPAATLADGLARNGITDGGSPPLSARLEQTLREAQAIAAQDERHLERLRHATLPSPLIQVPRFDGAVHDLQALWSLGHHLLPEPLV